LFPGEAYTHQLAGMGLGAGEVLLAVFEGDTLLAAAGDGACSPSGLHHVYLPLVIRN
jgi:hypothetical protein